MAWPDELPVDVPLKSEMLKRRSQWVVIGSILGFILFLVFLLSINLGLVLARGTAALPDIRILKNFYPNQSTRIFDRNNTLIANIHGDEDRVSVRLEDMSPYIQRAVMAIEDNRFYQHGGVDMRGTFRAMFSNLSGGDVQGGSTITQQLVKNLFLSPERSYGRKLAEAILAIRVESYYPKQKIIEMYLNQVYWGHHAYGIEKAARRYFKISAKDLSIAQSALLAGLLKAPEGLSPYAYPEAARNRQLEVLGKMRENGYITSAQFDAAKAETIVLNAEQDKPSKHPYYVTFVIQELSRLFGEDVVRRGGLKVYTALHPHIQEAAEKTLEAKVKSLPKSSNVSTGALVTIDVPNAAVVALVGGVDFKKSQFNNATQARRAAGSTFKPFVYLTGFRQGIITPDSIVVDRPIRLGVGAGSWSPKNWDGRYMGTMTVRKALSLSRNTTTVQIGMKVGLPAIIETAHLAGITSKINDDLSSLLGSSGISPLEMAIAFSTFARNGVRQMPSPILRVENVKGEVITIQNAFKPEQVFDPEPVANLNSVLQDVVKNGTGRSAGLSDRAVAGKTGTTDKVRDIWFSGYTPDMVTTIWMGNTKYMPLNGVFSTECAKVWHDFATEYYKYRKIPPQTFLPPSGHTPNGKKKNALVIPLFPEASAPSPSPVVTGGRDPMVQLVDDPNARPAASPSSNGSMMQLRTLRPSSIPAPPASTKPKPLNEDLMADPSVAAPLPN